MADVDPIDAELDALIASSGAPAPAQAAAHTQPVPVDELDAELDALISGAQAAPPGAQAATTTPEVEQAPLPERVNMLDPQGNLVNVPRADLQGYYDDGYRLDASEIETQGTGAVQLLDSRTGEVSAAMPEEARQRLGQGAMLATPGEVETEYGDVGSQLATLGEGALQGGTMGIYGAVAGQVSPTYQAERMARQEANPVTNVAGEALGTVGSVLATGGSGAVAKGVAAVSPAARLAAFSTRLGTAMAPRVAASTAGRIGLAAGLSAAEGAVENTVRVVMDDIAAGNVQLTAERMRDAALDGAKWGGAFGGGGAALAEGVGAASRRLGARAAAQADEVARLASEGDDALAAAAINARPIEAVDADIASARSAVNEALSAGDAQSADEAAAMASRLMDEREALVANEMGFKTEAQIRADLELPPQDQGALAKLEMRLNKSRNATDAKNALNDESDALIQSMTEDIDEVQKFRQNQGDVYLGRNQKRRTVERDMANTGFTWTDDQADDYMARLDQHIDELANVVEGDAQKLYSEQEKRLFASALKKAREAKEIAERVKRPQVEFAESLLEDSGRHYPIDVDAAQKELFDLNDPARQAQEYAESGGYTKTSLREVPVSDIARQPARDRGKAVSLQGAFDEGKALPPVVGSFDDTGKLQIEDGIHRVNASQRAGKATVPVMVKEWVTGAPPPLTANASPETLSKLFMVTDDLKAETMDLAARFRNKELQRLSMDLRAMNQDAGLWGRATADMQTAINAAITQDIRSSRALDSTFGLDRSKLTDSAGQYKFDMQREFDPKKLGARFKNAADPEGFKEEAILIGGLENTVKRMEIEAAHYGLPEAEMQKLAELRGKVEAFKDKYKNIKMLSQKSIDAERMAKESAPFEDFMTAIRSNPWTAPIGVTATVVTRGIAAPVLAMAKGAVKTEQAIEKAAKNTARNFFSGAKKVPFKGGVGMTANQVRRAIEEARELQDPDSDTSRNLAMHVKELAQDSPELAQAVSDQVNTKAQWLLSKLGPQIDTSDPFGDRAAPMDGLSKLKAQRYVEASQSIDKVLERVAAGRASAEDIEAMRVLSPAVFERFVGMVQSQMATAKVRPTMNQRNRLNFMLGIPTSRETTPEYLAFIQGVNATKGPSFDQEYDAAEAKNNANFEPAVTPGKAKLDFKADEHYASRSDQIRSPGGT